MLFDSLISGDIDESANYDLGARNESNPHDSEVLLYTDETKKKMNQRMSKRITEDLIVNENPLIYPGYFENRTGKFISKRPSTKSEVTESYVVSDP